MPSTWQLSVRNPRLRQTVARWFADADIRHVCDADLAGAAHPGSFHAVDVEAIRAGAWTAEAGIAPAIVFGDGRAWEDRDLALRVGARHFVAQPPDPDALLAAVRAVEDERTGTAPAIVLYGARSTQCDALIDALGRCGCDVATADGPGDLFRILDRDRHDLVVIDGRSRSDVRPLAALLAADPDWAQRHVVLLDPGSGPTLAGPAGGPAVDASDPPEVVAAGLVRTARGRRALLRPSLARMPADREDERRALDLHALVSIADAQGTIVYANDHFCQTSGFSRDELLGSNHRIVRSGLHPPAVYEGLWRTISAGRVWQGELCNRRKDGSLYWVATTIMPMAGRTRRYLSIRTDVTKLKSVQFALRHRARQQQALAALARRLLACDRAALLALIPRALRAGARLMGADRALWTAMPAGVTGPQPEPSGRALPAGAGSPDLVVPVGDAARPLGKLEWWRRSAGEPWREQDVSFAHALAGLLASAWTRTEADLSRRESDLALADMLAAFPGVVAANDDTGVVEFANDRFAQLHGHGPGTVAGASLSAVQGAEQAAQVRRLQRRIDQDGQPIVIEQVVHATDGGQARYFAVVHFATGGTDGIRRRFFQIGVDITERKRMEERLRDLMARTQDESRLQALLAAVATDLGRADSASIDTQTETMLRDAGHALDVDRAVLVRFDESGAGSTVVRQWKAEPTSAGIGDHVPAPADGWLGRQLMTRAEPVHAPSLDQLPAEAAAEVATWREQGLKSVLAVPIRAEDRVVGYLGFEALRQQMHWTQSQLRGMGILGQIVADALHRVGTERVLMTLKERAEAASEAKSDFLASMSHELRTPMNAVLGFGQLLEIELAEGSTQRQYVREILKGGRHLLSLIDDVLDLARVESGHVELSLEPIALDDLVAEVVRLMKPIADRRAIRIETEAEGVLVLADRVRLSQVLVNLMSNAIKYNFPAGKVAIVTKPGTGRRVRLEVRDSGPGIAREKQSGLFQPFNRLGAETGPIEGTGIGLVMVRRLVTMMGGTVGVDSAPGRGSVFWLDLPTPDGDTARRTAQVTASVFDELADAHGKRVLYIDDNPSNLRLLESILGRWPGVDLRTTQDPRIGLDLAQAHRPDLILLDIQMGPIDGFEVLRRLRRQPDLAGVPVVAITAGAMPRDIERAMASGFDDCITKPLDVRRLMRMLQSFLHPDAAGAGAPK